MDTIRTAWAIAIPYATVRGRAVCAWSTVYWKVKYRYLSCVKPSNRIFPLKIRPGGPPRIMGLRQSSWITQHRFFRSGLVWSSVKATKQGYMGGSANLACMIRNFAQVLRAESTAGRGFWSHTYSTFLDLFRWAIAPCHTWYFLLSVWSRLWVIFLYAYTVPPITQQSENNVAKNACQKTGEVTNWWTLE